MKTKPLSEQEQSIEQFVTQDCGLKYEVIFTGEQNRDGWKCDSWVFVIKGQRFEYSTGTGHRETIRGFKAVNIPGNKFVKGQWQAERAQIPPIAGVIHSLILDSSACNESFAEWCNNFDYDTDSRKALQTYEDCQKGYDKFRKVFSNAQIEQLGILLEDY